MSTVLKALREARDSATGSGGANTRPSAYHAFRSRWMLWVGALRLHQWVKNLLIVIPLMLAHEFKPEQCFHVALGFLIFGVVASGTYLMNDLNDLRSDRAHPVKRHRALASGAIRPWKAGVVASVLMVSGVTVSFLLDREFGFTTLAYVAITAAYSYRLKCEPMFDVFTIGVLFVLRLVAGMVLIDNQISLWLSGFAFTLFMSLAMAKRHSELVNFLRSSGGTPVGRGYEVEDIGLTRSFGVGNALIAFLIMLLYFQFQALVSGLYDVVELLYVVPVAVFAWTLRIWLKANRGQLQDDPITFALKDRISWAYATFTVAAWAVAIK
jgi:4-hydroxybenzoate polyprenyltransferase